MNLQEIFDHLSGSELSQMSLGGGEEGINEGNWERVLNAVNLGLTELHKRFLLREGRVTVAMQPGLRTYLLDQKHAVSDYENPLATKYLMDSLDDPFLGDVMKIERVYDAKGMELWLNSGNHPEGSIRTPAYNMMVVPDTLPVQELTVVYRAKHPKLVKEQGYFNLEEQQVDLPDVYLEALIYYVASRLVNPTGVGATGFHEGNNYAAKFEASCAYLDSMEFQNKELEENNRLRRNGWV